MKIDHVIFSTSETFSVFWNLISKVYKTKLGIDPICILIGDRSKTNMSEEFGRVIELPISPRWPHLIQITWSKFYWPTYDPDKTYLVGDIDLFPLSTHHFTANLAEVPDDHYVHLDADGITQLSMMPSWCTVPISQHPDFGCPNNVPGHYHLAKGHLFKSALSQHPTFEEELDYIVKSKQFNNTRGQRECDPIDQANLWCAEELRSTRALRGNIKEGRVKFTGFSLRHGIGRVDGDRLDKCMYDQGAGEYVYDLERLKTGKYVDLHCVRPFAHYLSAEECQRRWKATENVLRLAGML